MCAEDRKIYNPSVTTASNRLKLDQDGDTVNDYQFDLAGNTTNDAKGRKFKYDAEDRQVEVLTTGNQTLGKYFYDGEGRRIKKEVPGGETTIFIHDMNGRVVAEYSTVLPGAPNVNYLTNDHLGTARINTNQHGQITARHDYYPFGKEVETVHRSEALGYKTDEIRQKFTGYERDSESGLDFAQARYFDPGFGRFSSPDDVGNDSNLSDPQSWNLYTYVRNNPLLYIDSSGKSIIVSFQDGNSYKTLEYVQCKDSEGKITGRLMDGKNEYSGGANAELITNILNSLYSKGDFSKTMDNLLGNGAHNLQIDVTSGTDSINSPPGGATQIGPGETNNLSWGYLTINPDMRDESLLVVGTQLNAAYFYQRNTRYRNPNFFGPDGERTGVDDSPALVDETGTIEPTLHEHIMNDAENSARNNLGMSPGTPLRQLSPANATVDYTRAPARDTSQGIGRYHTTMPVCPDDEPPPVMRRPN